MKEYFHYSVTKISDANGIDELLQLRGLDNVIVKQAPGKGRAAASKITEELVWAMQRILRMHVHGPKPDNYGQ